MAAVEVAEQQLLSAARRGDESAFGALVGPHERRLRAHCYRMLGSVHDAEDAVQETLLRAWRALDRFEHRSSVHTWLFAISSNVCVRMLERRPARLLPLDATPAAALGEEPGRPLAEAVWVEACPTGLLDLEDASPEARYSRRESVELAFVAALQHLPPLQRAALILRDVLAYSARETATILDTSVPAANSALQRARKTLDERRPAVSQEQTLRAMGDNQVDALVARYAQAMEEGDVAMVVGLLTENAAWSMPPDSTWYRGEALVAFLREWPLRLRWRHTPTTVNGQPAVLCYLWDANSNVFAAHALDVLTLDGERIAEVTAFKALTVIERLGLPLVAGETEWRGSWPFKSGSQIWAEVG